MITVLFVDSSKVIRDIKLDLLMKDMPIEVKEKANRYRFKRDAYNYILGRLMLLQALKNSNLTNLSLEDIHYNKDEKPLIDGLYFSISHSEDMVVCSYSIDENLGIDIEQKRVLEMGNFKDWFTSKEWEEIYADAKPLSIFFRKWTQKESVLKAAGVGLSQLANIDLISDESAKLNDKEWYLHSISIRENYPCTICSTKKVDTVKIQEFDSISNACT